MAEKTNGAPPEPAATIRDSLTEAMTELDAPASAKEGAPEAPKPTATETPETGTEPSDGRARDPQGRFIAKEGEAEAPPAPKPAAATPTAPEVAAAQTAPVEPPGTTPAHWSAEDKAWVAGLPKEHQASVIDRFKKIEAGFTPKLQRAAALEKDYGELDPIFAPYQQSMQQQGWTKPSLIKAWAEVEVALTKDPYEQIRKIAQHYKVDLNKLAGNAPQQQQPAQLQQDPTLVGAAAEIANHPHIQSLMQELQALKGQVTGMTAAEQRRAQVAQEAATQRTLSEIQSFAEARGADGQPSHPHFNEVMTDMLAYAQAIRTAGGTPALQDLYDKAVWANPQTRARQIAAATAKAKAEAEAAQQQQVVSQKTRAEQARRAGSSVTGAPSGSGQASRPASKGSLRDDILAAADEA